MVCSACGFENGEAMRFCGMCGMPLPHRPLTSPGAQSTLTFTRVPVENSAAPETSAEVPAERLSANPDGPQVDAGPPLKPSVVAHEPPARDLVPDVPLDEYVQKFRYEPPNDAGELTMRGERSPVLEMPANRPATVPTDVVAKARKSSLRSSEANTTTVARESESAVPIDTINRLGLEPESPAEAGVARPRFLDFAEPPKASQSGNSGTSTIVGPSFLGLSDNPEIVPGAAIEFDEVPEGIRWRRWLAVVVVLVFVALALMEWRSQMHQTDKGPVKIIESKIHDLRQPAAPAANSAASPRTEGQPPANGAATQAPSTQTSTINPPVQVTPAPANGSSKTPAQQLAEASNQNPPAVKAPSAAVQATAPPPKTAKLSSQPNQTASLKRQAPAPAPTKSASSKAQTLAAETAGSRPTDTANSKRHVVSNDEVASKKPVPGADEMARASDASDTAATAAWLWKATAKGNPQAPVQLADMYIRGDGVPKSCEQALVLLKTAAAKQNAIARNRLASMYATGSCVRRDRVEAYHWLSAALAANPHSAWAQQNRDLIWEQMTPEERAASGRH